ncbi:sigma-70 family RNA polymerase sigma factor [Caulobacter mirabilis]|uniref:RNA polymerase subunit sigma-70 n=1 Tax=Caulobacter mirabilis TaxID=69666 RepID=A0A2D2B2N9_9CAUL|nr:sigma-70 family RNA polymerase sigma factor [Caulobacter mirabilis]ATQ44521.1 RNA polymerase subunit sigma-70 [Caulobacter mirabilis]
MDRFEDSIIGLLPRLRRFGRALARDAADADDLVQITLERALARREQWQPGSRLDSWTMRIMKNAWIDEARSRSRRRLVAVDGDAEAVADPGTASPAQRDAALAVTQAMSQLPEEQRLAVALVLVEGLSYAEAAEVLEIPAGTLTSRLVRGRVALMGLLEA